MAAQPQPQNAFFEMLAALQQGQNDAQSQLNDIATAFGAAITQASQMQTEALDAVKAQGAALSAQGESIAKVAEAAQLQAEILAKPVRDAHAAWLYAAGVDRDGTFNRSSLVGEFLLDICGKEELRALAPRGNRRTHLSREFFIEKAMDPNADRRGLPAGLTEHDFGRFYDLAQYVLQIAEATPTPPRPGP